VSDTTLRTGIDESHWNTNVDFGEILTAGCSFVGEKAIQGTGYVDPTFTDRRNRAHIAGVPLVLIYSFLTNDPGDVQAQHYLDTVGSLGAGEFVAIDLEAGGCTDAGVASLFWAILKGRYGLHDSDGYLYGSPGWLRDTFGAGLGQFTGMNLWAAEYGVAQLGDVSPWVSATIWQKSENATVAGAGAPGTIDYDVWLGEWPL